MSALWLPPVSFGTAAIAGIMHAVKEEDARAVLEHAWAAGLRYYDTAPHYAQGLAERRIGDFLRTRNKDQWLLSTKVGRLLTPDSRVTGPLNKFVHPLAFRQSYDYSYDGIMRSVEDSFQRLGLDRIDLLYAHDLGRHTHGEGAGQHVRAFIESGQRALVDLKSQGVIRAFGIGVNEVEVCLEVLAEVDLDVILLAGRYTLLDRSAESELIPLCAERGIDIVVGGAFNSGILATGAKPDAVYGFAPAPQAILTDVEALERICQRHGVPLAAAALAFPGRHPLVRSVLTGPGTLPFLRQNLDLMAYPIPDSLWNELDTWHSART